MRSVRSHWWIVTCSIFCTLFTGCGTPLHAPQWFFSTIADKLPEHELVLHSQLLDTYPYFDQSTEIESTFLLDPNIFSLWFSGANQLLGSMTTTISSKWKREHIQHEILIQLAIDGIVESKDMVSIQATIEFTLIALRDQYYVMIEWFDINQNWRKIDSLDLREMVFETQIGKRLYRDDIGRAEYVSPYRRSERINTDVKKSHMLPDPNNKDDRFASMEWASIIVENTIKDKKDHIAVDLVPEQLLLRLTKLSPGAYTANLSTIRAYNASFDGQRRLQDTAWWFDSDIIGQLYFPAGIEANIESTTKRTGRNKEVDLLSIPDRYIDWKKVFK